VVQSNLIQSNESSLTENKENKVIVDAVFVPVCTPRQVLGCEQILVEIDAEVSSDSRVKIVKNELGSQQRGKGRSPRAERSRAGLEFLVRGR